MKLPSACLGQRSNAENALKVVKAGHRRQAGMSGGSPFKLVGLPPCRRAARARRRQVQSVKTLAKQVVRSRKRLGPKTPRMKQVGGRRLWSRADLSPGHRAYHVCVYVCVVWGACGPLWGVRRVGPPWRTRKPAFATSGARRPPRRREERAGATAMRSRAALCEPKAAHRQRSFGADSSSGLLPWSW